MTRLALYLLVILAWPIVWATDFTRGVYPRARFLDGITWVRRLPR